MNDGHPPNTPMIGRYVVEATLGRGAMGVIYKAHDPVIDRKVAIKLVSADLLEAAERAEYIVRFRQEAQAAGRCSHPNIVSVYDYALHEGNPYLAMEFIEGVTLAEAVRARPPAIAESIELIRQVLDALHVAHGLGVVHRDIKPANIMVTVKGWVKVTDFGISRLDSSTLTGTGLVVGTPSYMSPEQCRGDEVDARSDLFSAGVVLYELVTGRKPFIGKTQHDLWQKLLNEDPPELESPREELPPGLAGVICRSMAKRPDERFASAAEMAAALMTTQSAQPDLIATGQTRFKPAVAAPTFDGLKLEASVIGTLERQLAQYVGPVANHLVRDAARRSSDVEELCRSLAGNIQDATGRDIFTRAAMAGLDASGVRTQVGTGAATPAEVAGVQKQLVHYIGPVGIVLVKRNAAGRSLADLRTVLATYIENPADRSAFLRQK